MEASALVEVDGLGFDGYDPERAAGTAGEVYDASADTTTSANAADQITITAGFIVDDAGNAATSDAAEAIVYMIILMIQIERYFCNRG